MSNRRVSGKILDTINEISDGKYMYVQDLEKNIVRWSKAAQEYFGLESECMVGQADHWFERIHPRDLEKYKKELGDVLSLKKDSFFLLYHIRNAKENYVLCRGKGKLIRDDDGKAVYFAGSISVCTGELIYDSLSGLQNANGFTKTINKYNDEGTPYLTMVAEFDNFQEVNSLYSYNFGSKVIFELSKKFHELMDNIGHVFRVEGTRYLLHFKW